MSGTSTVTGTISGLVDNTDNQQASSVFITQAPQGFRTGEFAIPIPFTGGENPRLIVDDNTFNVSNGDITRIFFNSNHLAGGAFGESNSLSLQLTSNPIPFLGFSFAPDGAAVSATRRAAFGFFAIAPSTAVPEPGTLALLAAGFGGFGFMHRRRIGKVVQK